MKQIACKSSFTTPQRNGIGRVELLATVVLIGFLLVLAVLNLGQKKGDSLRTTCELQQIQVAQALLTDETIRDQFSGYRDWRIGSHPGGDQTNWILSSAPHLFPIAPGTDSLVATQRFQNGLVPGKEVWGKGPFASEAEHAELAGLGESRESEFKWRVGELICPADREKQGPTNHGGVSYVVNCGQPDAHDAVDLPPDWAANGVFQDRALTGTRLARPTSINSIEAADGANHTLLLSENVDAGRFDARNEAQLGFVWQPESIGEKTLATIAPLTINRRIGEADGSTRFARPSSYHVGGVVVVYVSGRSQFLNERIDPVVFARLMMTNSEETRFAGRDELLGPPYRLTSSNAVPSED